MWMSIAAGEKGEDVLLHFLPTNGAVMMLCSVCSVKFVAVCVMFSHIPLLVLFHQGYFFAEMYDAARFVEESKYMSFCVTLVLMAVYHNIDFDTHALKEAIIEVMYSLSSSSFFFFFVDIQKRIRIKGSFCSKFFA